MKTLSALEAKNRFGQLLNAAQREPVAITRNGRCSVVVLSSEDYERRRRRAWKNLLRVMNDTGRFAASRGLTEERLARLLSDEG
ncbi:MAG TPA: type II toxin-antitoxin system Phd/YefM family antitoxin [Gammaproteobacteria bacterium]|nr:type II toxin-antitoxin system Phd/YefM family antitoxin [Gammaproteobacteria bacterium]